MPKDLTKIEEIDEAIKEYSEALKERVLVNEAEINVKFRVRKAHNRVQMANERLNNIRMDLIKIIMIYPIIYKQIPTQYAFYVEEDGSVKVTLVTKLHDMKFSSEKEARDYIKRLNKIL